MCDPTPGRTTTEPPPDPDDAADQTLRDEAYADLCGTSGYEERARHDDPPSQ